MLHAIQTNIRGFFTKGHERTLRARKNIFQSVLIKFGSVAISFTLIPLTIKYVDPTNYGIWLTLSSVITWVAMFDLGLGNGLKNKLAEDVALDNHGRAKSHVSSTYAMIAVISVLMFIAFCMLNPFINWQGILNAPKGSVQGLSALVFTLFGFFCIQFVVQLINTILAANQAPAKAALLNLVAQVLVIIAVLFLIKYTQGSLTYLVYTFTGIPLVVLILGSIYLYRGSYSFLAPSFSAINIKYAKELLSTGGSFFFIQIGALVLYETDNIVITQLFGPKEVTVFNVAYKLFSVILMFFVIIITPFWSAFTEAYAKKDTEWINATLSKINHLWVGLSLFTLVLLVLSPWVYNIWLGKSISVPFTLSLVMAVYTIAFIWQAIYVQFLNGIGKVRLQLYLGIVCTLVNIPLAIFLGQRIGVAGITISNTLVFVAMGIFFYIQTKKIIGGTAKGIFNT